MHRKKIARCGRCGKRLKRGGDNYRLECTIVADFDGYIDVPAGRKGIREIVEEIELSGMTEQELQEQVYYCLKGKLCLDCRNEIVNFLKGYDKDERR